MATDSDGDPAGDPRAEYDYLSEDIERPGFVADLEERIAGDVRFDSYSRSLYATDASIYEVTPIGVVLPRSTDDVSAVVSYCADRGVPVLPRGGGTSLAGQAVNEAVVLDFTRYMDSLVALDEEDQIATAQPGITLGALNEACADHDIMFAPDPAWGDKSALGGAIGNNSTGAHSLVYGKTDVYIEECDVVLADGTVTTFGEVGLDTIAERADPDGDLEDRIYAEVARILDEEYELIESRYPELKRNVSGYNLDWIVHEAESGGVNLARLLAGSEGTLAIVTEATMSLVPQPETKAMALLAYDERRAAMADVEPILEHDPVAVEVLDDVLLDLARDSEEFGPLVESVVPDGTGAVLLVEFFADSVPQGKDMVADLLADRVGDVRTRAVPRPDAGETTSAPRRAFDGREAHDTAERERFWALRKSGLPILLSRTADEKHVAFIEDVAIPPAALPAFVSDVESVLDRYETYASFYAHAGPGVLHIRPLINTKTSGGVDHMASIADDVTDLVLEYGGSVSGEHGDGRARTQWNRKLYGDKLFETFRDLKTAFDPNWLLNPGQVVYPEDDPTHMTENLRFDPDYDFDAGFEPDLAWENANGFQGMTELCHGCGGCRGPQEPTGGVMCPTFRASDEEITSTRGRANMLRRAMSGALDDDLSIEFMREVMDLCIGCKGCARDCPSEVDMAKLKAEVTHVHHERHGASFRDRLFANVEGVSRAGSALAPVSNWITSVPGAGWLAEKTMGIARERSLPTFHRESFVDWFDARGPRVSRADTDRRVLVLPDPYTNYVHPTTGQATVQVLEAAGVHVDVPDVGDTGRPAFSKGFLDDARRRATYLVEEVALPVEAGWDLLVIEPSDAVMIQSDYADLLGADTGSAPDGTESVMENTYGVCEYLDVHELLDTLDRREVTDHLIYHGHCHQKATVTAGHASSVLESVGYTVDELDSGCCGMAGSFGYEAEHYSMSRAIGRILYEQVDHSPGETVVAPGASCRTQLADHVGDDPPHPIEKVAAVLR